MTTKLRKVFIVHYSEDIDFISKYIIQPLEHEELNGQKVECIDYHRHFPCGKDFAVSAMEAVEECQNTFVVLTANALDRVWVKYEALLALEKSQRAGRLCVTLILLDLKPEVATHAWFGLLTEDMIIHVDLNKSDWETELVKKLQNVILNPKEHEHIRVAVNLAVGQVWSHFVGYTIHVMPKLRDRIRASVWYKQNRGRFPETEINLIPQSAETVKRLSELHDSIQYEGELDVIIVDHGSYRGRKYTPAVYSILDPETNLKYFFVGLIPNTLSILSKLEAKQTHEATRKKTKSTLKISKGERSLQVARFCIAFNRLVNHPKNQETNGMIRLVNYNDCCELENKGEAVARMLLAVVKDECAKMDDPNHQIQAVERICIEKSKSLQFERGVYVSCDETCDRDIETAVSLKSYLSANNFKIFEDEPGKPELSGNLSDIMARCKWCVLIVSKQSLHAENSKFLMYKWQIMLHQSVIENEVRVIPVLDGINEEDVPRHLCAVTYLPKDDEGRYMEKVLDIILCRKIEMEAKVSAEDVHQGLAWAYVRNYLEVSLTDRLENPKELVDKYPRRKIYKKLLIVVPSSCSKPLKALDKNADGELIDERFFQLPEIVIKREQVSGVPREYQLVPYHLQANDRNLVVLVEYPNPIVCLQEMSRHSMLSGLRNEDLPKEAWKFKELTQSIIESTEIIRQLAKLIYYDDSRSSLVDALLEVLSLEPEKNFIS